MKHPWWETWLEHKRKYAKGAPPFIDPERFNSIAVGTGLPHIYQHSMFPFASAREGADRFKGISIAGEKPYSGIYTRLGNPNTAHLENVLLRLDCDHILQNAARAGEKENVVEALVFSSGLSAIAMAAMALTEPGDQILAAHTLYGGTIGLFRNWERVQP